MGIFRLDPCYVPLTYKKDNGKVKRKRWENISEIYTHTNKKKANVVYSSAYTHKKKQEKVKLSEGKGTKESLFAGNMIEYIENSRKFTHTPLELMKEFGEVFKNMHLYISI